MSWSSFRLALPLIVAAFVPSVFAGVLAADAGAREDAIAAANQTWSALPREAGDPPIQEVALAGQASAGDQSARAVLIMGCRRDTRTAWIMVRTPEDGPGFPVESFEGPDGAGEQHKLGTLSGLGPAMRLYLSGSYQTAAFQFQWTPSRVELKRWLQAENKSVQLKVASPDRRTAPLTTSFVLPTDLTLLRESVSACR